jgi:S-phase kinase-associated protein 1
LITSEGEKTELSYKKASHSNMIKGLIDDSGDKLDEIPLPNITIATLKKIVEYLDYIVDGEGHEAPEIERPLRTPNLADAVVDQWFVTYMEIERDFVEDLVLAANFLDIKGLLDLACAKVATYLKGKTIQEVR